MTLKEMLKDLSIVAKLSKALHKWIFCFSQLQNIVSICHSLSICNSTATEAEERTRRYEALFKIHGHHHVRKEHWREMKNISCYSLQSTSGNTESRLKNETKLRREMTEVKRNTRNS